MRLPAYPDYKPSEVDWLRHVPVHWALQPLKRHTRLLTEKTDRRERPVALENIESWTGRFLPTQTEFEGEGVEFTPGDILFGKLRPYLAKTLVAESQGEAVGDFLVIRCAESLVPEFLGYQLRSREVVSIIDGSTFGSKMPRASWDFVGALPFALPPADEQETIVAFLDRETAKIDALIAEQEKLIALLAEKRQATISHAVTRGLNSAAPMKDSGVSWLGQVPDNWRTTQLKYVAKRGTSITYGIVQAGPHVEGGIPYIKTSDMAGDGLTLEGMSRTTPEIDASYARSKVMAGDIVIAIRATVGKCLPVPSELEGANLTQGTAKVSPGPDVLPEFLLHFLRGTPAQMYFDGMAKGATFKEITLDALRRMPIAVPPLDEQRLIATEVRERARVFDQLVLDAQTYVALLHERRSALITAAVTGQIDVRNAVTA